MALGEEIGDFREFPIPVFRSIGDDDRLLGVIFLWNWGEMGATMMLPRGSEVGRWVSVFLMMIGEIGGFWIFSIPDIGDIDDDS